MPISTCVNNHISFVTPYNYLGWFKIRQHITTGIVIFWLLFMHKNVFDLRQEYLDTSMNHGILLSSPWISYLNTLIHATGYTIIQCSFKHLLFLVDVVQKVKLVHMFALSTRWMRINVIYTSLLHLLYARHNKAAPFAESHRQYAPFQRTLSGVAHYQDFGPRNPCQGYKSANVGWLFTKCQ